MKLWIDCEFNEFGGDLISMALVAEDGQEFYEVLNLENDEKYGSWVYFNVVPYLNKDPIDKQVFQAKLWQFLNQWDEVHIIADWPDDIKYFCMSLITAPGMCIGTPAKLTMQIDRELNTESSAILHNALEDARAIKRSWSKREQEMIGYGVKDV
jgi:hypothetical protein